MNPDNLEHEISKLLAQHGDFTNSVEFLGLKKQGPTTTYTFKIEIFEAKKQ